ncbi:MAG TPA: hypothetical protein VD971_07490 [Phycisphaerales bacterium]|nr:hypothetical protein [Phycisphaerales bacterium]
MITLHKLIAWTVVAVTLFLGAPGVFAADKVTLKDGTTVEGTITRELNGYVWMKIKVAGIEQERFFQPGEVAKIERDAAETPKAAAVDAKDESAAAPAAPVAGGAKAPKGLVLTLGDQENGDMVGLYMVADVLKRAIPTLEKELGTDGTGILVLRIHSGGGSISEIQPLSDVIHNDFKPRFRVVGWIDTAISAAAMTSHCIEEIYFTSRGNYGACTAFAGSLDRPVEGFQLETILAMMEKISARGGYDYRIMRSMQIQDPLSATITPEGEVRYFSDATSGDIVVNREKDILTFNAVTAERVKFSRGTADTLAELASLMRVPEIEWVGKRVKGVPWPVSESERIQIDFRKKTKEDENRLNEYYEDVQRNLQVAAGLPREERGPFIGKAERALDQIKRMIRNNPNFMDMTFGGKERYEQIIKDIERQITELKK